MRTTHRLFALCWVGSWQAREKWLDTLTPAGQPVFVWRALAAVARPCPTEDPAHASTAGGLEICQRGRWHTADDDSLTRWSCLPVLRGNTLDIIKYTRSVF